MWEVLLLLLSIISKYQVLVVIACHFEITCHGCAGTGYPPQLLAVTSRYSVPPSRHGLGGGQIEQLRFFNLKRRQ
jgi:hypothetical protein